MISFEEYSKYHQSKSVRSYKTYGAYSLEEILPFIGAGKHPMVVKDFHGNNHTVSCTGYRLETLKRNQYCLHCSNVGTIFLLQKCGVREKHFNLYAIKDNKLILMTIDHIIPKSMGGDNNLYNLRTMCHYCNSKKGSSLDQPFLADPIQ